MGCCSGSDFTTASDAEIEPSQRVNYSFGMVLGVDDFKQEHAWLGGRDERALREVIGYGVVTGLDVTLLLDAGAGSAEIRVGPGLAVCPDGKVVAVTSTQCARLDTWLAGPGRQNPVVPGSRTAYVVLAYAEKSSTPVPIPGEPCRDESSLQADSRITDGFRLELRWAAPSSEEDDVLREFVAWLRQIEVQDQPLEPVSIAQFQDAIEQSLGVLLSGPFSPPASPPGVWDAPPRSLVIPRARYTEYLSAAFDVWVRKLRPLHMARFGPVQWAEGKGTAESAILLTRVEFELSAQGVLLPSGTPSVLARTNGLARPQLLHLRLLQEWSLSNVENDAPREAYYVLDKADPRLPNAQDLHETFFSDRLRRPQRRGSHGPMARVDELAGNRTRVVPAEIWSGPRRDGVVADYYGPNMLAPILVSDGGTGQSALPSNGQILVGDAQHFTLADVVGKSDTTPIGEGASLGLNIVVEHAPSHDIVLDTVQAIHPQAAPTFAGLTLRGMASTLLATNADAGIIPAMPWDGNPTHLGAPFHYAPGQPGAVRIEDGGTGLKTRPKPLQLLVGRTRDRFVRTPAEFVLATLRGGDNVSVKLVESAAGEEPEESVRPSEWGLEIDCDIQFPIAPVQGGTGLTTAPKAGDILLGTDAGAFALAAVAGSDSVSVTATEGSLSIDTAQALHSGATPTFQDVILSNPPSMASATPLGWDKNTSQVVRIEEPIPVGGSKVRRVRVVDNEDAAGLRPEDEVLVAAEKDVRFTLPPAQGQNGRVLTFKSRKGDSDIKVEVRTTDEGVISLEPSRSVTVIASEALKQWLVIGRS